MAYDFPPDIQALIDKHMDCGGYKSIEELLRHALVVLAEEQEDLQSVRQAIAEFRAGDPGTPLDEAFERVRNTHSARQGA